MRNYVLKDFKIITVIIIHFKTKEVIVHESCEIGSNFIKCRRLKTPLIKIILTHINPSIPNETLENYTRVIK